jgi:hypothetical protein
VGLPRHRDVERERDRVGDEEHGGDAEPGQPAHEQRQEHAAEVGARVQEDLAAVLSRGDQRAVDHARDPRRRCLQALWEKAHSARIRLQTSVARRHA